MEDWTKFSDEKVFGSGGEQPGSQASVWRETEIKRRIYVEQKRAVMTQIEANRLQGIVIQAQRAAVDAQEEANAVQREAAAQMKRQSTMMLWSVIGIFLTALATLVAALF